MEDFKQGGDMISFVSLEVSPGDGREARVDERRIKMGFKSCLGAPALMAHEERSLAQMPRSPPEPYPQSGGQAACASGRAHPCYHIPQASLSPGLLWGRASSGVSGGQCCLWLAAPRGSWGVLSALHFLVLALLSRGRSGCDERGSGNIFLSRT